MLNRVLLYLDLLEHKSSIFFLSAVNSEDSPTMWRSLVLLGYTVHQLLIELGNNIKCTQCLNHTNKFPYIHEHVCTYVKIYL